MILLTFQQFVQFLKINWQIIVLSRQKSITFVAVKIVFLLLTKKLKIMSEIESRVKAVIVDKLGVEESEVTSDASFTNDLGADSLDTVELIMEFEKQFEVKIPEDQADKISTVGDAIAFIEKMMAGAE